MGRSVARSIATAYGRLNAREHARRTHGAKGPRLCGAERQDFAGGQTLALGHGLARLAAQLLAAANEAQQLRWKLAEEPAADAVDATWVTREAGFEGQVLGLTLRAREAEDRAATLEHAYAVVEGRAHRLAHEVDGVRLGHQHRVAELEAEIERLAEALAMAADVAAQEVTSAMIVHARTQELLAAENEGLRMRVDEAERALAAPRPVETVVDPALEAELQRLRNALVEAEEIADNYRGAQFRLDRSMGDLEATAVRLAETEDQLAATRAEALVLGARVGREDALRSAVDAARRGISSLLADGRGALLAPELMALLRSLEVD